MVPSVAYAALILPIQLVAGANLTDIKENNQHKSDQKTDGRSFLRRYIRSADFWTAIATVGLGIVGVWGVIETKRALKLSERAWVFPAAISLTAPVEVDKQVRFNIVFLNSGKEPATDVGYAWQNGTLKAPPPDDWTNLAVEKNLSCEGLIPREGGQPITPSLNGLAGVHGFDSENGKDPVVASKAIVDGNIHYYIRGCVSYKTFEETHTSSFCYVLQTRPGVDWHQMLFLSCPTGFDVN